jgi:DNA-directed RNA polymerase specialized sigma24 family protein
MEQRKTKWRDPAPMTQPEQLLASYYGQLLKWGAVLSRGDEARAEDIVQEFCLYFTLTKPDLSGVANLDGYIYTCLRHIYLSGLARSSREALHFISVAEFDSFDFAPAANQPGDPLQRQNDLRRICGYAVWRKEFSKSASYFIFHFFHGYSRREIAEIARLPIAAIYNKLKSARAEVRAHLEEADKLRIVGRNLPPEPALSWSLLPVAKLFEELRETILQAHLTECLSEEELLAQYHPSMPRPIDCSLLAHIVSCERCLAVIDQDFRRPTLKDREPLDGSDGPSDNGRSDSSGPGDMKHKTMLRSVRKHWEKVHEHRPRTLSIAVNGKIIALHNVQVEHSMLSARIEHPERAEFVEVFSEQDVRLALLSVGDHPPEGLHTRTQRVALSDSRWLELNLSFDGLGLNSQVAYFDPAMAIEATEDEELTVATKVTKSDDMILIAPPKAFWIAGIGRFFSPIKPSSAMAWALTLTIILGTAGYLAYQHSDAPLDAREILNGSARIEAANLRGQTEHQAFRLEEISADGKALQQGVVDVWKDGDGDRYVRRLYDSDHRLIAAKWRNKNGEKRSHEKRRDKDAAGPHRSVFINELWDQDISAHAFNMLAGKIGEVHAVGDGYELTTAGPVAGHPQLISATLILDHHLLPVGEIMRVRSDFGYHELRFVQSEYEHKPSQSVPDAIFEPENEWRSALDSRSSLQQDGVPKTTGTELQLAQLQISVLHQLNKLGADTGEPIEVVRTYDGHLRVSGAISSDALRQEIVSSLETSENHQLLDLKLISPSEIHVHVSGAQRTAPGDMSVYDVDQAKPKMDTALRSHFQAKGLSGERLDSTIKQYSQDALQHAQRALQHAYALDRLSSSLSAAELKSIGLPSQQQWTEMVHKHATDLEEQLRELHSQLAEILPQGGGLSDFGEQMIRIEDPTQFNRAANQLLHQTQDLNSDIGRLFASNPSGAEQSDALLATTMKSIPLRQSEEITRFAVELKTSSKPAFLKLPNGGNDKGILEQPR